jgi:IS30 family transposase
MLWHLIDNGGIVRSCEAGSLAEARFLLRPLTHRSVISAASFAAPVLVPSGTIRERLARPKTKEQRLRSERTKRYQRRKRGEQIPKLAKGTPNEKLRRLVLSENVNGETDSAIARRVRMSAEAVRHTRLLLGLPNANTRMAQKVLTYRTFGWSDRRIARRLNVEQGSVSRILRRHAAHVERTANLRPK